MRDLKRGHIFGAGLDKWIEGNCGEGLDVVEDGQAECHKCGEWYTISHWSLPHRCSRICCRCGEEFENGGNALDPICPDCVEATAVPEGDDGR
jgi:hypothetical protein